MHFLCLKSRSKPTPSRFPSRVPIERAARLQDLFYISIKFLINISLNEENFPFSQRLQERRVPSCSPKAGPLWKQTPIFRALLSISFGVPSTGALSPDFPYRAPSERRYTSRVPFIYISRSLVNEPPSRFPIVEEESCSLLIKFEGTSGAHPGI